METDRLEFQKTRVYMEDRQFYKLIAKVSLDDDCKNGMCDFSVTGSLYIKKGNGHFYEHSFGCLHEEINKHMKDLQVFTRLHLSNHYGQPMYPVENGFYHLFKSDKKVAMEYLRITEKEYEKLHAVNDKLYFKNMLFQLGIVARWANEANEAIKELEALTGNTWVNPYSPETERFSLTLTDEEANEFAKRTNEGFYTPENVEKREREQVEAEREAKRDELVKRFDDSIRKIETERKVLLYLFDLGVNLEHVIYYDHNNTVEFNWRPYKSNQMTEQVFNELMCRIDYSQLPEGIKFKF